VLVLPTKILLSEYHMGDANDATTTNVRKDQGLPVQYIGYDKTKKAEKAF
jgi:hypothetical protein